MFRRNFLKLSAFLPFIPLFKLKELPKLEHKKRKPEVIPLPVPDGLVRYSTDPTDEAYNHFVTETSAMYSGM